MADKIKLVCETCVSSDRRLVATSRILSILKDIQCEELQNKLICWECHSLILKFYKFKIQAKIVQIALHKEFQNCKNLSKLTKSTKLNYDFEFVFKYDYTNETTLYNEEKVEIKYENNYDATEYSPVYHSDNNDEDKKSTVFVDSLDYIKQEILLKKKRNISLPEHNLTKKKLVSNHQEQTLAKDSANITKKKKSLMQKKTKEVVLAVLKEKFETVQLTEEEMLRSREEKKNHPNYKKIPYKCDTCVLGFTKKDNYDLHFAKKHDEAIGSHVCDVCSIRFVSERLLASHRALHFVRYACSLCAYKTTTVKAAGNHCKQKHALDDIDSIHCKQCFAVFRTCEELSKHTSTEHTLYCKDCGKFFKGKHTLRAHRVRIHAVKREFACEVCRRSFLSRSRLESHLARHSPALARRLAYCAPCDIQYKDIRVYRSHVQNSANHQHNRYPCPGCDKKFASKIYRNKHYNFYHLNKSHYKCVACNKLFISEWRLKNHRQKHHGLPRTRDHQCGDCQKSFYTSATLAVHRATHSPARRHLCARCGAHYRQPAALYTHQRRAHPDLRASAHDALPGAPPPLRPLRRKQPPVGRALHAPAQGAP